MLKPRKEFICWFTGFWEGEGCLYLKYKGNGKFSSPRLTVTQNGERGKQVCNLIGNIWGCGHISKQRYRNDQYAPSYRWDLSSLKDVIQVIKSMLPHCRCRRKELEEKLGVIASIISRSPIWTSTLDIKLNKLFSCGLTDAEIGRRMGRSTSSILHRRISLGIYRVGPLKEKPVDWTHDEIILLKDHYGQEPIKGLMARLSRSYNAITHKAHSLGLKAKKEVMKSYV